MSPCDRTIDALVEGPLPADLSEHAATCPHCRAWVREYSELGVEPKALSTEAELRILTAAKAELTGLKPSRRWWAPVLQGSLAAAAVVAIGLTALQTSGSSQVSFTWESALLAMAALALGWLAFAPGLTRVRLAAVVGVIAAGATRLAVAPRSGAPTAFWDALNLPCFGVEWVVSAVPLILGVWLLTRFAFQLDRALALGLAGGAAGLVVLHAACPNHGAEHLLSGHFLPWLACTVLLVLIRRALRSRSFAP